MLNFIMKIKSIPSIQAIQANAPPITTTPKEDAVLAALYGNEIYGLQIPKAIEEASNGTRSISQGALYPILAKLEKKGLVSSRWGDQLHSERGGARRRYYRLTDAGQKHANSSHSYIEKLFAWQPV